MSYIFAPIYIFICALPVLAIVVLGLIGIELANHILDEKKDG